MAMFNTIFLIHIFLLICVIFKFSDSKIVRFSYFSFSLSPNNTNSESHELNGNIMQHLNYVTLSQCALNCLRHNICRSFVYGKSHICSLSSESELGPTGNSVTGSYNFWSGSQIGCFENGQDLSLTSAGNRDPCLLAGKRDSPPKTGKLPDKLKGFNIGKIIGVIQS